MINPGQLKDLIIIPTLSKLQTYSDDAAELLLFTCAVESEGGSYIKQVKGPALGIYQLEPNTHTDIWINYIQNKGRIRQILAMNFGCHTIPQAERLIYDLRVKEALPKKDDIDAMYAYYKKYYNTEKGKATKDKSIKKYEKFINF
jgi:hypothetical protein